MLGISLVSVVTQEDFVRPHFLFQRSHHLAHRLLHFMASLFSQPRKAVHLVNEGTVAARFGNPFGYRIDPPLAKIWVQHIKAKNVVAVNQLPSFRINDQEFF